MNNRYFNKTSAFLLLTVFFLILIIFIFLNKNSNQLSSKKILPNLQVSANHEIVTNKNDDIFNPSLAAHQMFNKSDKNILSTNKFSDDSSEKVNCDHNHLFVTNDETPIYTQPNDLSPKLRTITGEEFQLDPRYDLLVIDKTDEWLLVRAISPKWPSENLKWSGWIKKSVIYNYKSTSDEKACVFFDFSSWTKKANGIISEARNMALNIPLKDKRCHRIVNAGFIGSGQRYFLSCYPVDGGKPYHYWFSLLKSPNLTQIPTPVTENRAYAVCLDKFRIAQTNMHRLKHVQDEAGADEDIDKFANVSASSSLFEDSAWKIELTYTDGIAPEKQVYCFVGPTGMAEIIFPVQP